MPDQPKKILLIDDEASILHLVEAYLQSEGYEVAMASDGLQGLKLALELKPSVIVLDIMLPGIDGLEVLSKLRRESNVYVILLTAKNDETDKIIGLSMGADDYLTKPFSPRELVARIKAALRRMGTNDDAHDSDVLEFSTLSINKASRQVWESGNLIDLTATEFEILKILAENENIVLSREQLLEKIWGFDYFGELRVVDVHVGHLRKKLSDQELIQTVRGVGYRFADTEQIHD